jgi:tetratricopeptide (TPR) repeat protein
VGDAARAAAHYREALARRPSYTAALANLADLLSDEGNTEEALALYGRAIDGEPANAQARLNRAMLYLSTGNLKAGWRDYGARLKLSGKAPIAEHTLTKWDGAFVKHTRLLVSAEQGVGDQVMFASMLPELAERAAAGGASIILECERRLVPLFARSFPGVAVHGSDHQTMAGVTRARYGWLKAVGGANAAIELGSLPRLMRGNLDSFRAPHSFLKPDALESALWGGFLASAGRGPFIGLCWRSGKMAGLRSLQYAPLESWAAFISRLPGTLVSVQYDAAVEEVEALERMSGRTIFVPPGLDQKIELDRSLALLFALDAVVTAPTAVSWLAAGAGVDTYKILYDKSWTSFAQPFEPFAPSCLCMMPQTRGDWSDTFAKTLAVLTARL